MQEAIKTFPKISNSNFWTKMFINISNGKYPEEINITETRFYYRDDYVDINKCKDVADFYTKVINMLKKYINKDENWVNIKKNIRIEMVRNYAEKKAKKYQLDEEKKEKLISTLNMILFLKNSKSLVTINNGSIKKIKGIRFKKNDFYINKIFCTSLQITKRGEKDIFTKQCNKFEKNLIRKISTYR